MKKRIDLNYWLFSKPIAHRGLYSNENNIPENTKPAFDRAIEKDIPVEMDVQMSKDGILFVYHDDNAKRICGVDKDVRDMDFEEIMALRPLNLEYTIFTFHDFLSYINGRIPLVIEIKSQKYPGIEEKIVSELNNYKGDFVVQSFNPFIMKKIHKLNPDFITGIITTREYSKYMSRFNSFLMSHFVYKLMIKPDYFNSRVEDLKINHKHIKRYPVICWTLTSEKHIPLAEKYADNIIFESTCRDLGKFTKNYK